MDEVPLDDQAIKEQEKQKRVKAALAQLEMQLQLSKKSRQGRQWMKPAARACALGAGVLFFILTALLSKLFFSVDESAAVSPEGVRATMAGLQHQVLLVAAGFILLMMAAVIFSVMRRLGN